MKGGVREIYALERLSGGDTSVHRLNPTLKLLATAVYTVAVVSFGRYDFARITPFLLYPALMMALSSTPFSLLFKRFLVALPFCVFAGVSNLFIDKAPAFMAWGVTVSYGALSFLTILLRTFLCVMAVLTLVSVTPLPVLTNSLRRLKTPHIFVVVFEMTYRYIGVLFGEARLMYTAYSLRSAGKKGVDMRDMGGFAGQLLIRGFDRAERVYSAMNLRGYAQSGGAAKPETFSPNDFWFFGAVCVFCAVFRFFDMNAIFSTIFGGFI